MSETFKVAGSVSNVVRVFPPSALDVKEVRKWLDIPPALCCLVNGSGTLFGKKICTDCYRQFWYEKKKKEKEDSIKEASEASIEES